jgi:hypothetical protein
MTAVERYCWYADAIRHERTLDKRKMLGGDESISGRCGGMRYDHLVYLFLVVLSV